MLAFFGYEYLLKSHVAFFDDSIQVALAFIKQHPNVVNLAVELKDFIRKLLNTLLLELV